MVADTTLGPETGAIVRHIHDRAAATLLQQNGSQFSFTIAGFGISSSFCIPLVAVWAGGTPEFFNGTTLATSIRGVILSASSMPPHDGRPAPAGPLPPPAAPTVTYRPSVPEPLVSNGRYPSRDKALQLILGGSEDSATRSERKLYYKQVLRNPPHFDRPIVPLCHDSNISVTGSEDRGSVGVFPAPEVNPSRSHLLTACHVLGATTDVGSTIQTISFYDVLRELTRTRFVARLNPQEQDGECAAVFARVMESVATLVV
jgi:hypothetical protein